ncbi:uncharacterized protein LOC109949182 [Prunus persica]|uniref:uncharacterized protein LOC109949182 n=1 Tax=Prunus persica TaxID=3760 RepID=UPI0009AB4C79|nr:uncharacterized protein LOC109949182 [Prunus persica]
MGEPQRTDSTILPIQQATDLTTLTNSSTISDPLVLHHSDTPGLTLANAPLKGNNYGQWSRSVRLSLSAKNKLGLIDGSVKAPPSTDAKFPMWQRCNDMVLSWLLHSIHPDIANSVLYSDTTAAVWNDLKDRFSQRNDSRIHQIRQEIVECRQGQQSVSIYYTKLKALWDELSIYHEPLICDCEGLKKLADREEKEKVMQFLMGLNDSYSTVRGSILMMNPIPDTRRVHGLILQHERQMEVASRRENPSYSHAMQTSRAPATTGFFRPYKPSKCSHCDQEGHSVDHCYYIIGFPIGHKWHGKNVQPRNKKPPAHNDKRAAAHNVELETPPTKGPTASATGGPTFTTEQYNQLLAMLHNKNGNAQSFACDSGATDHISRLTPTHYTHIGTQHDFVGLPNGEHVAIESIGSVRLTPYLSLDGVLHVSKFRVNLLSDVETKRMIGLGKHFDGLYYLTPQQNPHLAHHIHRYPLGQKGYLVYDLDNHKIVTSRDVLFHEHMFPFAHLPCEDQQDLPVLPIPLTDPHIAGPNFFETSPTHSSPHTDPPLAVTPPELLSSPSRSSITTPDLPLDLPVSPSQDPTDPPHIPALPDIPSPDPDTIATGPPLPLRRSNRPSHPPAHFQHYQAHHAALL